MEVMELLRELEENEPDGEMPPLTLSEDYLQEGGLVARRRVVEAGFRLGKLLELVP